MNFFRRYVRVAGRVQPPRSQLPKDTINIVGQTAITERVPPSKLQRKMWSPSRERTQNDNEVQIQAISVYLTNEQGRLVQVGNRLDSIRHDLDIAAANSREAAAAVAGMESELADVQPQRRDQWQRSIANGKKAADLAAQKEADLRIRERDALQEFQTERDQYTTMWLLTQDTRTAACTLTTHPLERSNADARRMTDETTFG